MGAGAGKASDTAASAEVAGSEKQVVSEKQAVRSKNPPGVPEKPKEQFDLRKLWGWDPQRIWVCDIVEKPGEPDNDFLFMASISSGGGVDSLSCKTSDRCIFQDVMYDVQKFMPDKEFDGRLDFKIEFGDNTKERKDAPRGWTVVFKNVMLKGPQRYEGTIHTSWWGDRPVKLINYTVLTSKELQQFPDLQTNHYFTSRPR
jgi:hypothetical protein